MTFQRHEELISAYLDGELAPPERADVERWLAESPEMRQLHDDLLALRRELQLLPRHALDRNLAAAVTGSAERRVLAGETEPRGDARAATISIGSVWSRGAGWRRLIWPAVAIAAAVLIMVFSPSEPRQVAQAPQGEVSIGARPGSSSIQNGDPGAQPAADTANSPLPAARPLAAGETNSGRGATGELLMEKKAVPSQASGNMAAPADVNRLHRATPALQPPESESVVPTLTYTVPPRLLSENRFEQLLEQRQITWSAEPEKRAADERAKTESLSQPSVAAPAPDGMPRIYLVEISDQQWTDVVAELNKSFPALKQLGPSLPDDARRTANDRSISSRRRIILRPAPASSPAAPAKPGNKDDQP